MVLSPAQTSATPKNWPSARYFTEAIQCPAICFSHPLLRTTFPAVDRLSMPLVTSGQFAYVYKLKSTNGGGDFAVRCFRGYLGDRDQRYRAIQEHLKSAPVSYLSEFTYAPEGILVGGHRFPILFMKWIEGPTLDLYISEMLRRPDVLLHLCEEWKRLVSALRASGVAHGDLQHGNIIVEHGQLRLVDHDGIFVTAMSGWTASEVGHQHYQHPRRNAQHFDINLDNFCSRLWNGRVSGRNTTTRTCFSLKQTLSILRLRVSSARSKNLVQSTAGSQTSWRKRQPVLRRMCLVFSIW